MVREGVRHGRHDTLRGVVHQSTNSDELRVRARCRQRSDPRLDAHDRHAEAQRESLDVAEGIARHTCTHFFVRAWKGQDGSHPVHEFLEQTHRHEIGRCQRAILRRTVKKSAA